MHLINSFPRMKPGRFLSRYCSYAQKGNTEKKWRELLSAGVSFWGRRYRQTHQLYLLSSRKNNIGKWWWQKHSTAIKSCCSSPRKWGRFVLYSWYSNSFCLMLEQEVSKPHIIPKMSSEFFRKIRNFKRGTDLSPSLPLYYPSQVHYSIHLPQLPELTNYKPLFWNSIW